MKTLNTAITLPGTGYTGTPGSSIRCLNVYCHSNGNRGGGINFAYRTSPDWYNPGGTGPGSHVTVNKCGMCHDNPPQYSGQSHFVANSNLGNNGTATSRDSGHMVGIHFRATSKGNNNNGFLGFSSSGTMAHGNKNLSDPIGCYICHASVVSIARTDIDTYAMYSTGSRFECRSCHKANSRTPLRNGLIANTMLHVNGVKDIAFPTNGVPEATLKTKAQLVNNLNALNWNRSVGYKGYSSYDSANLGLGTAVRVVSNNNSITCTTRCHIEQPGIYWGKTDMQCISCHANQ
jgi:predicted CxxxxCH...CXXCH cytochrome family protein